MEVNVWEAGLEGKWALRLWAKSRSSATSKNALSTASVCCLPGAVLKEAYCKAAVR